LSVCGVRNSKENPERQNRRLEEEGANPAWLKCLTKNYFDIVGWRCDCESNVSIHRKKRYVSNLRWAGNHLLERETQCAQRSSSSIHNLSLVHTQRDTVLLTAGSVGSQVAQDFWSRGVVGIRRRTVLFPNAPPDCRDVENLKLELVAGTFSNVSEAPDNIEVVVV